MNLTRSSRALTAVRAALRERLRPVVHMVDPWLGQPGNLRRASLLLLLVFLVLGLLLPPVSLATRLTTVGYAAVRPGSDVSVPSDPAGAWLEIQRQAIRRSMRIRLTASDDLPRGLPDPPSGGVQLGPVYHLDIRGPTPREALLDAPAQLRTDQQPFLDPYGWDGMRWRWLPPQFVSAGRVRVALPFQTFAPQYVMLALATASSIEVSAVLLQPPAVVPAAVAALPILELRAYHLRDDDGSVAGRAFQVPSREARIYGVIDNREGNRLRSDLVNNMLILPQSRQRHREAIVATARRDGLDGIVLDYDGIAGDLQHIYSDMVRRLTGDLHRIGAELIVTVPVPLQTTGGWDGSPYAWRSLGDAADGLRIRLPNDAPLQTEALDSMVRWTLERVDRRRLQLAVPVQGRDLVGQQVGLITFGDSLGKILDMAQSDAPDRVTPGTVTTVEMPTIRASELGIDPATGMWHFYYWGPNRRRHSVWLNDAAGLKPAFDIATRYRLARLALDGVAAGLDPSLWRMVQAYINKDEAQSPGGGYRLAWQLLDEDGRVVQEAFQPLDEPTFRFQAPHQEGRYRLAVHLASDEGRIIALGGSKDVYVAPPPPPTPPPTLNVITIPPTPETIVTAPPPPDERYINRNPVRAKPVTTEEPGEFDATVAFATVELRAGPGFGFEVISDLRPGERLQLAGRSPNGEWLKVRLLATGVEGWVRAELLELKVDADVLPVVEPVTTATAEP